MKVKSVLYSMTAAGSYILLHISAMAQNPRTVPAAYSSSIKTSYVRSWDAVKPGLTDATITSQLSKDVKQATQYVDALARPLQTVIKEGSLETVTATKKDLVTAVEYDELGREQFKYLPFVSTGNDGNLKLDPFQQQASFMSAQYGGQGETFFYGQTKFETSPLNRPAEIFAPGNSWAGSSWQTNEADRKAVKTKFWNNTTTDNVQQWNVTDVSNAFGTYSAAAVYGAGQLTKTISIDENNKQVIEFKDKEGKVILKKVQLTGTADDGSGTGYTGWLCTYYVYDKLGNLRCVIQPEGVKTLSTSSWSLTTTLLNEQCFRYEYDGRNRMQRKKVPGAGEVWMVYDARDRLVMTQDAIMRNNHQWLYTTYDSYNRPVATGLLTDNTYYNDLAYHAGQAYNSTSYPNLGSYTTDELTRTFYDDYSWRSSWGNPLSASINTSYNSYLQTAGNTSWPYPQAVTQSSLIKGLVTGSRIKVLGTSTYLFSVSFYDDRGRVIQAQTQNVSGGTDIITTQYSFAGQPLVTITKTEKAGTNAQTIVVVTQLTYDDMGRMVKTEKKQSHTQLNGGAMSSYKTITDMQYDKPGQLKKKILSPAGGAGGGPLENAEYDYNIRGWMLGMNRVYAKSTSSTANWFGFDLGYDKTPVGSLGYYNAVQLNGNITGSTWKSTGDDEIRKFDYSYDAANRLLSGSFTQYTGGSFSLSAGLDFSVSNLSFDANGNIMSMNQKGWKLEGSTTIDQLTYTYISGSNKLAKVSDAIPPPSGGAGGGQGDFKDGANGATDDYGYDVNGNMNLDNNKAISSITYNHLNLPLVITVTGKGTITYTYDAAGSKLKKVTVDNTVNPAKTTTTLYIAGAVYQNDTLQFLGHEEGRMRISGTAFVYDYFLKDHLGNVRMVLTEETKTDAYPAATMETANATTEESFYSNLPATREDAPSGYGGGTPQKVAKVRGDGNKIGPAIILKVMAGDKFNLTVNSWWAGGKGTTIDPPNSLLTDLVNALNTNVGSVAGNKATAAELSSSGILSPGATDFLNNQGYDNSKPKAYVNWILFDEQFKYVSSNSGFEQVGDGNEYSTHTRTNLPVDKSGYLYIYVSNETPNIDVFFDNLQVTHIRGPLIEETHYYPFGLTITGISNKALSFGKENKYKFNGIEYNADFDLNIYDARYRNVDPQIGRFWQIDPKGENDHAYSLYSAFFNNPIFYTDPNGDWPPKWRDIWKGAKKAVGNFVKSVAAPPVVHIAVAQYNFYIKRDPGAFLPGFTKLKEGTELFSKKTSTERKSEIIVSNILEFATALLGGRKGPKILNKAANTLAGDAYINLAKNDGVTVNTSSEIKSYLKSQNAEAAYMGGEGKGGAIIVGDNPTRGALVEEAFHHYQRRTYGDDYFYNPENKLAIELEAQNKMLEIGKQEGWAKEEMQKIEVAKNKYEEAIKNKK